jgi:CheY-like chemotaxis protein
MSAPTTPLKIMLVEDDTAFREALAFVLAKEQELEVVAQAGTLAEARQALDGGLEGAWTWRSWTWPCPTGTEPS